MIQTDILYILTRFYIKLRNKCFTPCQFVLIWLGIIFLLHREYNNGSIQVKFDHICLEELFLYEEISSCSLVFKAYNSFYDLIGQYNFRTAQIKILGSSIAKKEKLLKKIRPWILEYPKEPNWKVRSSPKFYPLSIGFRLCPTHQPKGNLSTSLHQPYFIQIYKCILPDLHLGQVRYLGMGF